MALDNINTVTARVNDLYKKLADQDKDVLDVDKNCIDLQKKIAELEKKISDLQKTCGELKTALDNKKDKKTAEQESTALAAEQKKFTEKQIKIAQDVADGIALKTRFGVLEASVDTMMAKVWSKFDAQEKLEKETRLAIAKLAETVKK